MKKKRKKPAPKRKIARRALNPLRVRYEELLNAYNDLLENECTRRVDGEDLAYQRGYDAGYKEAQGHLFAAAGEMRAAINAAKARAK